MKTRFWHVLALLGVLSFFSLAIAEDIDLYDSGVNDSSSPPNVLIILDTSANWGTQFQDEKAALIAAVENLDTDFNLGVAMSTAGNIQGLYVRYAVRPMDGVNKPKLQELVNVFNNRPGTSDPTGDKANNPVPGLSMAEAYRYFRSLTSYTATQGGHEYRTDYKGNVNNPYVKDLGKNAFGDLTTLTVNSNYKSPVVSSCAQNYIIYVSNGTGTNQVPEKTYAKNELTTAMGGVVPQAIPFTYTKSNGATDTDDGSSDWFAEWAKFLSGTGFTMRLNGSDQTVTVNTYVIEVSPGSQNTDLAWTENMKIAAVNGNGHYYSATDTATLTKSLNSAFNEIKSVNSVFAAVTLPVSVSVRGEYLNQVYLGVFRPDGNRSPRWPGNLKLYQLGCADATCSKIELQGSDGQPVENVCDAQALGGVDSVQYKACLKNIETVGTVKSCARSMWTKSSTFWNFAPVANCLGSPGASDLPDGYLVEKGGAAQVLRENFNLTNRKVLTDISGALVAFKSSTTAVADAIDAAYNTVSTTSGTLTRTMGSSEVAVVTGSAFTPLTAGSDTVIISSTTPAVSGYATTPYTVATVTDATHFTFNVSPSQTPPLASSCNAITVAPFCSALASLTTTFTGTRIVRANATTAGDLAATVTVSGTMPALTDSLKIDFGASPGIYSGFNGTYTPTSISGQTFNITLTDPGLTTPASVAGSATVGANTVSLASLTRNGFTVTATMTGSGNTALPANFIATANVTISGATPSQYNGTWAITTAKPANANDAGCPNGNNKRSFCFYLLPSSVTSATKSFSIEKMNATAFAIDKIIRDPYTGTNPVKATVTTKADHPFTTGGPTVGITIPGSPADESAYLSGAKTITRIDARNFSFDVNVTELPVASATATVSKGPSGVVAADLINWVRGADNYEDENGLYKATPLSASTDVRASVHDDIVHSRPVVLDYRTGGNEDVIVFYGGNQGMLHAIKGGTAATKGTELWTFVANEHYGKLNRLRKQAPVVTVDNRKPYFFDGPIGSYVTRYLADDAAVKAGTKAEGEVKKAYLFVALRRGGRTVYAFDVTDYTAPTLVWTYTNAKLGQTWSAPTPAKIRIDSAGSIKERIAVIFGGGYDPAAEDPDVAVRPATTMGNAIFVLVQTQDVNGNITGIDTTNSQIVTDPAMRSIPGDVYIGDITADGYDDVVYASDTGGNVWRLDINDTSTANWTLSKLFSTGDNQKFLAGPVVALGEVAATKQRYYAVMVGGGDREHPTISAQACSDSTPPNWYYMIQDFSTAPIPPETVNTPLPATLTPSDLVTLDTRATITDANGNTITNPDFGQSVSYECSNGVCAKKGWKVELRQKDANSTAAPYCEKNVSASAVVNGIVFFNTNAPPSPLTQAQIDSGVCINTLGTAWNYAIGFQDGTLPPTPGGGTMASFSTQLVGGGFAPSPVIAYTRPKSFNPDGGTPGPDTNTPKVVICIGQHCYEVNAGALMKRFRTYWYENKAD